jgi:hypothetical protein
MEFNIKEWIRIYNNVHYLNQKLKDSMSTIDESNVHHCRISNLSVNAQKAIELEIKNLIRRCANYLNDCGMPMPKPLWSYDSKNPKTWLSHSSFKYKKLLKKTNNKCTCEFKD